MEESLEIRVENGGAPRPGARSALVTGGTGVLGPLLVSSLVREGWAVRVFCRTAPPSGLLPGDVDVRIGDITNEADVGAAIEGVGTVFHLAGLLHNPRPDPGDIPLYEAINVDGARHVARGAAHSGASVICFSTISVYGATADGPVDETTTVNPAGPYALTKWRGEEALLSAGLKVSVLRLAAVYGRRMKGNYKRLVDAMRRGYLVAVGDEMNRRTLVHEEDVIRAAILAADRVHEVRGVYNVTDGQTHSMREILAAIGAALDRPVPRFRIPEGMARLAARGMGQGDLIEKYLENVEVKGDLIQNALGFTPRFDLVSGWRQALSAGEPA